jgi:hypothetical protein
MVSARGEGTSKASSRCEDLKFCVLPIFYGGSVSVRSRPRSGNENRGRVSISRGTQSESATAAPGGNAK